MSVNFLKVDWQQRSWSLHTKAPIVGLSRFSGWITYFKITFMRHPLFFKSWLYLYLLVDESKIKEHQVTGIITQSWLISISLLLEKYSAYQIACWKIPCLINQKIMAAKISEKKSRKGSLVTCRHTLTFIMINPLNF